MKPWITFILSILFLTSPLSAEDFVIEEARSEDSTATAPFSLSRVVSFAGGLRIFVTTADIEQVQTFLDTGNLEAQLSDHNTGSAAAVSLALGKAIYCSAASQPLYVAYSDTAPVCDGQPPERIEFYLEAAVALGPGRDLAIVRDPDFLWLIEQQ